MLSLLLVMPVQTATTVAGQVGVVDGVIFLTYSGLISSSDAGATRMDQLADWAGPAFDGLIIFDECHKAKNLVPDAGGKPTKVPHSAPQQPPGQALCF